MGYSIFREKGFVTKKENLAKVIQLAFENLKDEAKEYDVYNIVNIGSLMEGEAYYHEIDEYYKVVGIEVEIESQFTYDMDQQKRKSDLSKNVGFYSLWKGKSSSHAPITFEEGYGEFGEIRRFGNGYGDHVSVVKTIITAEKVQEVARSLGLLKPADK